jgi:hypothetical protein
MSVAFACALAGGPASAQVLQPPPRSLNGLFGGPRATTDRELSATINLTGSLEDNVAPGDQEVSTDPFLERRSGSTASASGELRYRHGTATRSIESMGSGYVHSFRNIGVTPMYGGNAALAASTALGGRTTLGGGAYGSYQPSFMLTTTLGPLSGAEIPVLNPTTGVIDLRTSTLVGTSTVTYSWTPRQHTGLTYGYNRNRVFGGALTNSTSHEAGVSHGWDVSRPFGLQLSYRRSELRANSGGSPTRPTMNQSGMVGIELRKRVSRTRTMQFNLNGGAMHVRTLSETDNRLFDYVTPSASAGVRLDMGRTWALAADANRDVSVIEAVTTQSFVTDSFSLRLGGRVATSWVLAFYGAWNQGKPHQGEFGSFEAGNGSAQVQYNVTSCCSVLVGYEFYTHRLRDINAVPAGFPSRFERNALVVGVSIFVPLYGQFSRTGRD